MAWVPLAEAVRGVLAGDLHNGVAIVGILSAYVAHGKASGRCVRLSQRAMTAPAQSRRTVRHRAGQFGTQGRTQGQ